jgi:hypothetical protein
MISITLDPVLTPYARQEKTRGTMVTLGILNSLYRSSQSNALTTWSFFALRRGPRREEPDYVLRCDPFEILNRPIGPVSREFTRAVPVDSEHERETSAPSRFHSRDSILGNSRPLWVAMWNQSLQTGQENVRFRFAMKVQLVADHAIDNGLKNIANSCLLQDRHSIPT